MRKVGFKYVTFILLGVLLISFISATDINESTVVSNYGNFTNITASWFNGKMYCSNIQGADYDVCLGSKNNPFDQSLNTTDSVNFLTANATYFLATAFVSAFSVDRIDTSDPNNWNFIGMGINVSDDQNICIDKGYCLNDLANYLQNSDLPLENQTIVNCANITGASYDVCVGDGSGSSQGRKGDGFFLYNDSDTIYFNATYSQLYLNFTNERITWVSDTDFGGYSLTNVGGLIMGGLITSQNITPITDNLYSIGNSTNWFKEIFVHDVYSENINATEINTTDLNANNIDSTDIASDRINTTNATIGGFDVYKDGDGDMNIDLG